MTPRELCLAMYRAALDAADPRRAVARSLTEERLLPRRTHLLSLGKAAIAMTRGALDVLGDDVTSLTVVAPSGADASSLPAGARVLFGDHPTPSEGSVRGGEALLGAAAHAGANDLVLVLLSGGASSLAEAPREPLTLEDLVATTKLLLASGAPVTELNAVRAHLSRLKGGGLLAATGAPVLTIAISDVAGEPPSVIGSGPTSADATTWADVARIVKERGVEASLPDRVRALARDGAEGRATETRKRGDPGLDRARLVVACDGLAAARAAASIAAESGFEPEVDDVWMTGDAASVARDFAARARSLAPSDRPRVILRAGETTVTVRGGGRGGRSQHLALAFANERVAGATLAALSTDGVDGPTDAAGAIVDGSTIVSLDALGVDVAAHLARCDAYPALDAVSALVRTGPTGTNVGDLAFLLVTPRG